MTIKSILAVTDFSPDCAAAFERAALLASQHGARLDLLHLEGAPNNAITEPVARLEQRARQFRRRFGIEVAVRPRQVLSAENMRRMTEGQDLLVVHRFADRLLARMFKMTAVDRMLRHSRCPVLLVRGGVGAAYQAVVAAVDFSDTSRQAALMGSMLAGSARLELFHCVSVRDEARLRSAEVSTAALVAYRGHVLKTASHSMDELTQALALAKGRAATFLGRGDPARQTVVRQRAVGADLVVVGRRPQSALADVVAGSVAHHLLACATSDVLVVPARSDAVHALKDHAPAPSASSWLLR
jgi:nucleotide-binding universal stress UspA family protein